MASEDRPAAPALAALPGGGAGYDFFQALRLLRAQLGSDERFEAAVRFRADLNLAFSGTDLAGLERDAQGRIQVMASFFGLYGVTSPLPTFYTEDLLEEAREGKRAMRGFLDVLHNALYPLLFQAWQKPRLWHAVIERRDPRRLDMLMALVGRMGVPANERDAGMLRFAPLFAQAPRSALALQALVREVTGVREVDVQTCVENDVAIPETALCRLSGNGARLGEALAGTRVARRTGVVRLHIGPLDRDAFYGLLPDASIWKNLRRLLRAFVQVPIRADLVLTLKAAQRAPSLLGGTDGAHGARLGLDTWLGEPFGCARAAVVSVPLFDGSHVDDIPFRKPG